mmetsp:Transcript_48881/g.131616  ORF Transcript_48881/g.131616 Transcript_48881/m.131616 type:complete len:241 (-) Transcript_48881:449-1171(-)
MAVSALLPARTEALVLPVPADVLLLDLLALDRGLHGHGLRAARGQAGGLRRGGHGLVGLALPPGRQARVHERLVGEDSAGAEQVLQILPPYVGPPLVVHGQLQGPGGGQGVHHLLCGGARGDDDRAPHQRHVQPPIRRVEDRVFEGGLASVQLAPGQGAQHLHVPVAQVVLHLCAQVGRPPAHPLGLSRRRVRQGQAVVLSHRPHHVGGLRPQGAQEVPRRQVAVVPAVGRHGVQHRHVF